MTHAQNPRIAIIGLGYVGLPLAGRNILLEIIEVRSGSCLGEDDIVRFEDNNGRNT